MKYSKVGKIATLENNGLKVSINYDDTISLINSEIKDSEIYRIGKTKKNLYYFKKKNVELLDYKNSLEGIKNLLEKIFKEEPDINIFQFLELTKKNKFKKNRVVNLAVPVVGLFYNQYDYKYISFLSLQARVMSEDEVLVSFSYMDSDANKFEPIFFEDYTKPIIREKLKAIRTADLKIGTIYSDEKGKKYFLYLGKAKINSNSILKESISLLDDSSFTEDDIEQKVLKKFEEIKANYFKYGYKYQDFQYAFIELSKKEFEAIKKESTTKKYEEYLKSIFHKEDGFENLKYNDRPVRVFNEEFNFLEDTKEIKFFARKCSFYDNSARHHSGYPDFFTDCLFIYYHFLNN